MNGLASQWSVYLLRCGDGTLYTGIATDVARRLGEHETGKRGSRYLRGRGPFEIVYQRPVGDRSLASRIEYRVRKLPKGDKDDPARLCAHVDALLCEFGGAAAG